MEVLSQQTEEVLQLENNGSSTSQLMDTEVEKTGKATPTKLLVYHPDLSKKLERGGNF